MRNTYKIETYLPLEALNGIRDALYNLGLGKVGNYEDCLSWYQINSSWKPIDGAPPTLVMLEKLNLLQNINLSLDVKKI